MLKDFTEKNLRRPTPARLNHSLMADSCLKSGLPIIQQTNPAKKHPSVANIRGKSIRLNVITGNKEHRLLSGTYLALQLSFGLQSMFG